MFNIRIGCSWHPESLWAQLQKRFTGHEVSHSFLILEKYYDIDMVFDAKEVMTISRLHDLTSNQNAKYWIFNLPCTEEGKRYVENHIFHTYLGEKYGYVQSLWFIYRKFCEKFGLKYGANPFENGILCSESCLLALRIYKTTQPKEISDKIEKVLEPYTPNGVHSGDILNILTKLKELKIAT